MKNKNLFLPTILSSLAISLLTGCGSQEKKSGFTVKWLDYDQTVLEVDKNVASGTIPSYDGRIPSRAETEEFNYVFIGWDPEIKPITSNTTFVAQYDEIKKSFTVTWCNYDGTVLETDRNVRKGSVPEYNGAEPARAKTAQYSYTFVGWDKELNPVIEDITYTALFAHKTNKYTITWMNGDQILDTEEVEYGSTPIYTGLTPEKESTQTKSYEFSGWSPEVVAVVGDATYTAEFIETPRKYSIKFYDGYGNLVSSNKYEYEAAVIAPTGTFRTFFDIVGYNAKVNGEWDSTLLTSIPNATDDVEYKIVTQVKTSASYLLSDLSNSNDVVASSWDYATYTKANVNDAPVGATLSNRSESVRISSKNGIATLKVGSDFFYALKNNVFNDTDFIKIYAKFPTYANGSYYNDISLLLCKGMSLGDIYYGVKRDAATDNTGPTVFYNEGLYYLKQVTSNSKWQEVNIYVSEIKAMLAMVPNTNKTEWDSIVINGIRNAANPSDSNNPREFTVFDVEFHRVDISKDFIINDCTNMAQIRPCKNSPFSNANNNSVGLYDTRESYTYNNVTYQIGKPSTSIKDGDMALNDPSAVGGWNAQCVVDFSFIADNIDLFNDNDKIVAYLWGFNGYGFWVGRGFVGAEFFDCKGINITTDTTYGKKIGENQHRVWFEATITIGELKALTEHSTAHTSTGYTHSEICKANWLIYHFQCGPANSPNLIYSVELHHAS